VSELEDIKGVGEKVALSVVTWMRTRANIETLEKLRAYIQPTGYRVAAGTSRVYGKTFVFTGTLPTLGREEAKEMARAHGGQISNSVSKSTDFVVVGEQAGSKEQKANNLGVTTLTQAAFLQMLS